MKETLEQLMKYIEKYSVGKIGDNNIIIGRTNWIVVGTGEWYYEAIAPAIKYLEQVQGNSYLVCTIDIKPKDMIKDIFPDRPHLIRKPNQKLSNLLKQHNYHNILCPPPVIYIGHRNDLHTPDAIELMKNFKCNIMIPKPKEDTEQTRELLKAKKMEIE